MKEFLTQTPSECYAKSEGVVTLGYITYDDFLETLNTHPKDYVRPGSRLASLTFIPPPFSGSILST